MGAEELKRYKVTDKLEIRFCGTCGVRLFSTHQDFPGNTYISLGTLDDDEGIAPRYHQFAGSKAKWHQILDELPKYAEWD